LSAAQQEQLKGVLLQLHGAAAAGCRTELWTLKRIGEVIRKQFGVRYKGQTFMLEPRYAAGKPDLMPEQAAELERSNVDVIVAGPFAALQAAKNSTSRVPIIMTPSADPTATGIVTSLVRPGGNITGITEMMPELTPQRLRLLKQIVPTMSRAALLWQPGTLTE